MEFDLTQSTLCFYGQVCYNNFAEVDLTDPSVPVSSTLNINDKHYKGDILSGSDYTVCITLIPAATMCVLVNPVSNDEEATRENPILHFNGLMS